MTKYRNIIKVDTESEYQSLIMGGFPAPSVVNVKQTGNTHIRGIFVHHDNAIPGDIVCFHKQNGNMVIVDHTAYNDDLSETFQAEAVVVVPASHSALNSGKLVCASLNLLTVADTTTPNPSSLYACVGQDYRNYTGIISLNDNIPSATTSLVDAAYLPTDNNKGEVSLDGHTKYIRNIGNVVYAPSPYTDTFAANDTYTAMDPTYNGVQMLYRCNVLASDVRAKTSSTYPYEGKNSLEINQAILSEQDPSDAFFTQTALARASVYATEHIAAGNWFIPSMYELGYFVNRNGAIFNTITNVTGAELAQPTLPLLSFNANVEDSVPYAWTININGCASKVATSNIMDEPAVITNTLYNAFAFTYL